MKRLVADRGVAVVGVRGVRRGSASAGVERRQPRPRRAARHGRHPGRFADAEADHARSRRRRGAADRRGDGARQDRGESEPRLEGRAAGGGRITSVLVKIGDAVAKDQPLLTIQSPDADAAMSTFLSAQAGVTQARAALVQGAGRLRPLVRSLRAQRRREEGRAVAPRARSRRPRPPSSRRRPSREQAQRRLAGPRADAGRLQAGGGRCARRSPARCWS